jgi:hypothetical protein
MSWQAIEVTRASSNPDLWTRRPEARRAIGGARLVLCPLFFHGESRIAYTLHVFGRRRELVVLS